MNKKITVPGVAAVVALVVGFGAGYFVPHAGAASAKGQYAQFAVRMGAGASAARSGGVAGQILSADSGSITVKSQDGSTKIVLVGTSTPILISAKGSMSDLTVGTNVIVSGNANGDGSITAQSVQIRPTGSNAPIMRYVGQ